MTKNPAYSTDNITLPSLYPTRILAVQTMYSFDMLLGKKDLSQISSDYIDYYISKYNSQNLDKVLYLKLLKNIEANLQIIDEKIKANLQDSWALERLPKLVLAILRTGIGEIIMQSNLETGLLISDYLRISNSLNHIEELGFINSILDRVIKNSKMSDTISK